MSNSKTTWSLGLDPDLDLTSLSIYEVIGKLEVVEAGTWKELGFQPVIFSVVLTDGLSITANSVPEGVTRLHIPFSYTLTTLFGVAKPSTLDFQSKMLKNTINKTVNTNGRSVKWQGMNDGSKLEDSFRLLYGKGPVYELDNDASTVILPLTLAVKPGKNVGILKESNGTTFTWVLIEDLVKFTSDGNMKMEEFSLALLKDLISGAVPLPDEPSLEDMVGGDEWPGWNGDM